jgi:dihydrodipicolinate synthase/N-acetylneuraminate lyase
MAHGDWLRLIGGNVVVPIPPAYTMAGELDLEATGRYLDFLHGGGVQVIMTTAGTSQFNLLKTEEIRAFNQCCAQSFPGISILGLPPLAERDALFEVEFLSGLKADQTALMALYPDRFYGGDEVVAHLSRLAQASSYPMFFHGMFMRSGTGGLFDFNAELVNRIAKHENIVGMKEECATLSAGFALCSGIEDPDFITIVAGGSQRRFMHLGAAGASTFLAGLENLFPGLDQRFLAAYRRGDLAACNESIQNFETPFFEVFMKLGWHAALRAGLEILGHSTGSRMPFPRLGEDDYKAVRNIIEDIQRRAQA